MDFLTSETGMRFLVASAAVGAGLAIFAGILWFLRNRPVAPLLTRSPKERRKRLTVVDAAIVDTRRRVVLIRRDNVEHLIMIGGPTDIVIESGIGLTAEPAASPLSSEAQTPAAPLPAEAPPVAATPAQPPEKQPSSGVETAMPSEATDFTYGPEAVLSVGRDYEAELPAAPNRASDDVRGPASHNQASHNKADPPGLTEENAEAIIDMMRERILGQEKAGTVAANAAPHAEPGAGASSEAKPPAVADSAFARVLDGREQPDDLPPVRTPTVQPPRTWAPPVDAIPKKTHTATPGISEISSQTRQSEAALELEVARILEEMQQRRKS